MDDTRSQLENELASITQSEPNSQNWVDAAIRLLREIVTSDFDRAKQLATAARSVSETLGYDEGILRSTGMLGYAAYMESDLTRSLSLLLESVALAREIDDTDDQAGILNGLSSVSLSMGNYEKALSYALQSLRLSSDDDDATLQRGWSLYGAGMAYQELGDYAQALSYNERAFGFFAAASKMDESPLDPLVGVRSVEIGRARALTGIGTAHRSLGNLDEALSFHERSLESFERVADAMGISRALNDLGDLHLRIGDVDRARDYLERSLTIRRDLGQRGTQCTSLISLSRLHLQTGSTMEAITLADEALQVASEIRARPRMYQCHEVLADAYATLGDHAKALEHYRLFHEVRTAVVGEETNARISSIQTGFEIEKAQVEADLIRSKNKELSETNTRLEQLLRELERAQDSLVQSQKLAALGKLTAGIAHEIKNPLNFINNFSALSIELADELKASVIDTHGTNEEVMELVSDIASNNERILAHGKRADSIVQNMLRHSRGSAGEFENTNLNEFVDEYVDLAFHGTRASSSNFVVDITRSYDPKVGALPIIQQDMGRVFINLLNNAFFAVDSRRSWDSDQFRPSVHVSTHRNAHTVTIVVADNGGGVPEEQKHKIFEPFFTTKPAGEGTGLGLSMSFEIVASGHGGTLELQNEPGVGASFAIQLPLKPSRHSESQP